MNSPILGLDIGLKRTGLALSESGIIARPYSVLEADIPHMTKVIQGIAAIVESEQIQTIVVGLPYTDEGKETDQSQKVWAIIEQLKHALGQKRLFPSIVTINEFYSSVEAAKVYPDTPIDSASATLILQEYLDANAS